MYREHTKVVKIGNRVIGGGNQILIQSMTNTKTDDVRATVAQIQALTAAGCDIIRCAVPTQEAASALKEIKKQITIPLVADIHFDYKLAIAAIENGADKIRINPGNIGSRERVQAVVDAAKERNIPIRVGVNSGSLEKDLEKKYGESYQYAAGYKEDDEVSFEDHETGQGEVKPYGISLSGDNRFTEMSEYIKDPVFAVAVGTKNPENALKFLEYLMEE